MILDDIRHYLTRRLEELTCDLAGSMSPAPEVLQEYSEVHALVYEDHHPSIQKIIDSGGIWTGTIKEWVAFGPLLISLVDIREVRFTDMEPLQIQVDHVGTAYVWSLFASPKEIFEPGLRFSTPEDAQHVASKRALVWAHQDNSD